LNFAASAQFLVVTPLLPAVRDQLGVDETWLGLLVTSYAIGVGVLSLIGGPWSDRVGRRRILVLGSAAMAGALLLHAAATSFPLLVLVRLLAGSASGLLSGATIAYVGDAIPYHQRGRANGILASGFAAGQIFGIPLGAWLGEAHFALPFVVFSGFVAIASILVALFVRQPPVVLASDLTLAETARDYWNLAVNPVTGATALAYTLMFLGVGLFVTYLPTELGARFSAGPSQVSTLFAVGGVASLIMGPIAGALSDRFGRKVLVVVGSALSAVLMFATPFLLVDFWVAYPMFFAIMVFVSLRISPMQALVTALVAPSRRGRLVAFDFAIGQVGFGLGGVVAGPMYEHLGFLAVAAAGSVAAAGMAVVVGLGVPEVQGDTPETRAV
jgi:predicted MFS family arabinose efflux permease